MLFSAAALPAQIAVESGKQVEIPAAGVTSALSIDTHVAQAVLQGNVLTIHGGDPGDTMVVTMSNENTKQIAVHVFSGQPSAPPGFVAPENTSASTGSYETRFSTDRLQFENVVDLSNQSGRTLTQSHFAVADFAQVPGHALFLPSAYYRIVKPGTEVTILDRTVNQSPLTVSNVIVRGLHIQEGAWSFHGGYTNSADFSGVLVPTEKETVIGISRTGSVGSYFHLKPSVYFLRSIDLRNGKPNSAFVASLLGNIDIAAAWHIGLELAEGRGLAYGAQLEHNGHGATIHAQFTRKKASFPSLRSGTLPGLSGDASWTQLFTRRASMDSGVSVNDVSMTAIRQSAENVFADFRVKIGANWSANSGVNYGSFASPGSYSSRTLVFPQSVSFDRPRFGAGVQYQFATATDSLSNGEGIRQTARVNAGRFQITQYLDVEKDALSVNALASESPAAEQNLARLRLAAFTPDRLPGLLRQVESLNAAGAAGTAADAQVMSVPRRTQAGGGLTWISAGPRPHQLNLTLLADHNSFPGFTSSDLNLTGTYAKAIGASNLLQVSGSMVRTSASGAGYFSPLLSVSFRHTLFTKPEMALVRKHSAISGTVFVDSMRRGLYRAGMQPVAHAVVALDGQRTVLTDANGHFRFGNVSSGDHQVELRYNSDRDHYFTSPNQVVASAGANVDFGIAFPKRDLWGYVRDDAGFGMAGIQVLIDSPSGQTELTTEKSGKFLLADVEPGHYSVQVNPDSLPVGYSGENLATVEANITTGSAPHIELTIPAMRVVSGTVTVYDAAAGRYVPVKGAVITAPGLHRSVTTPASGRFTLAGLPAGDLEIRMVAGRSTFSQTIIVPEQPGTLRDDLSISSLTGQVASTVMEAAN